MYACRVDATHSGVVVLEEVGGVLENLSLDGTGVHYTNTQLFKIHL